jgi:hypothetical protein
MEAKGVTAVAINQNTLHTAAAAALSCDLWEEVQKGKYQAIFCSPDFLSHQPSISC